MFSLRETTRIRLGRAAFVALCVVPACAVLSWSAFVRTPSYRRMHERAIAEHTGFEARLGAVRSPRPGMLLYESLELADRQTDAVVATLPLVEVRSSRAMTSVRLALPATLDGARLDALLALLGDLTRRWPQAQSLAFEAHNVTLRLPSGDQSFTDVVGQLDGDQGHAQAKLTFRRAVAGTAAAEPCLLTLTRGRGAASAETIQLTTGTTPLPIAALAALWPGVEQLGKTCYFTGRMTAARQSGGWRVELAGHVSGIDLDVLVSRQFRHKLTGMADVRLKSAVIENGRLHSAAGSITAGPGSISRSLVQAAETHLHIQAASSAVKGPGNVIPYEHLDVGFEIGPEGMALRGEVPETRGALLVDARRVLAIEPPLVSQPVVDLVRTLVPQSDVHVPATRETAALTSLLPVPSIVTPPGSEQPLPRARPVSVNPLRKPNPIRR